MPLSFALKELRSRNAAVTALYRDWAWHLPPGPVTRLTASIAGQRQDLSKTLGEIAADRGLPEVEVEFDGGPESGSELGPGAASLADPKAILKKVAETEAFDHELLAAIAGAVLAASSPIAERLASEAASARKRSIWAQDQLDLLSML